MRHAQAYGSRQLRTVHRFTTHQPVIIHILRKAASICVLNSYVRGGISPIVPSSSLFDSRNTAAMREKLLPTI
eukprot:scaffold80229_cov18-Prasinocladus_malaysianus.AAC.1